MGDTELHDICVAAALKMLEMDSNKHISYVIGKEVPGWLKEGGPILRVTIEFVDAEELSG